MAKVKAAAWPGTRAVQSVRGYREELGFALVAARKLNREMVVLRCYERPLQNRYRVVYAERLAAHMANERCRVVYVARPEAS